MPDLIPAPGSIATSAPRPISFLTVSGVAAPRGTEESVSAPIAIFMLPLAAERSGHGLVAGLVARATTDSISDQEVGHSDHNEDDHPHAPFHQGDEVQIGLLVGGIVVALRDRIFRGVVRGHHAVLSKSIASLKSGAKPGSSGE